MVASSAATRGRAPWWRHSLWLAISMIIWPAGLTPALATFHLMHIELVAAGIDGVPGAQVIQFRTRAADQELMSRARLRAWDAAGRNPVLLIDFATDVPNAGAGDRALAVSARFLECVSSAIEPDYVLTTPIPDDYLAAGSITFEDNAGTFLVCRLSWGGAAYTGSTVGSPENDDDGQFGPPLSAGLLTTGNRGWWYNRDFTTQHISNLSDYALTDGPITLTNNARQEATLDLGTCPLTSEEDIDGDGLPAAADNCPDLHNPQQTDADSDGVGDGCDDCPDTEGNPANAGCPGGDEDPGSDDPDPPPDGGGDGHDPDHDHDTDHDDDDGEHDPDPPPTGAACGRGASGVLVLGVCGSLLPRRPRRQPDPLIR